MKFWEVSVGDSKVISGDKNCFKFGNKVTNIASIDVILKFCHSFWIYFYIIDFWRVRSLPVLLSVKSQFFSINKTYNCFGMKELHSMFFWKFLKVLANFFSRFLWVVTCGNSLANKNIFNVDDNRAQELL